MPATVALAPRRSQRIAMRATEQRYATSSPGRIERPGHARRPSLKPKSFTQQLFAALDVAGGSVEVKGTLAEVEERLEKLYKAL